MDKSRIIAAMMPYITALAARTSSFEDAMQDGVLALLEKLAEWDPRKGPLTNFVAMPIKFAMMGVDRKDEEAGVLAVSDLLQDEEDGDEPDFFAEGVLDWMLSDESKRSTLRRAAAESGTAVDPAHPLHDILMEWVENTVLFSTLAAEEDYIRRLDAHRKEEEAARREASTTRLAPGTKPTYFVRGGRAQPSARKGWTIVDYRDEPDQDGDARPDRVPAWAESPSSDDLEAQLLGLSFEEGMYGGRALRGLGAWCFADSRLNPVFPFGAYDPEDEEEEAEVAEEFYELPAMEWPGYEVSFDAFLEGLKDTGTNWWEKAAYKRAYLTAIIGGFGNEAAKHMGWLAASKAKPVHITVEHGRLKAGKKVVPPAFIRRVAGAVKGDLPAIHSVLMAQDARVASLFAQVNGLPR